MDRSVKAFSLGQKIVVITGAGSGIGLSFAQEAIRRGARGVLIADLELSSEAEAWHTSVDTLTVVFQQCDVTNWDHLSRLSDKSREAFGDTPDLWVPAAGVFEPTWSNFYDDTESQSYKEVAINMMHPIKLTRNAIRSLLQSDKPGVVLLIASDAGLYPFQACPLYVATKHAVVGFVRCMDWLDSEQGVKIISICPGFVYTRMITADGDSKGKWGVKESEALKPLEVACAGLNMVENVSVRGGSVYEITKKLGIKRAHTPVQDTEGQHEATAQRDLVTESIRALLQDERRQGTKFTVI